MEALILAFDGDREVWRIDAATGDALERAVNFSMGYSAESRRPVRVRGMLGDVPDWEFTLSHAYFA